jgi:hypothetical protein
MRELARLVTPFARRVRLVRGWAFAAVGGCVGAFAALVWAGLDWGGVAWASWIGLGACVAVGAALGAVAGLLWPLKPETVARSIDRRAHLNDRLTTAWERAGQDGVFDSDQRAEAIHTAKALKPGELFRARFGPPHLVALALSTLAAGVFLLGNSPLRPGGPSAAERQELAAAGQVVQRVAKPLEKRKPVTPAAGGLGTEMRELGEQLEKGRLDKMEAMRQANKLAEQAEKAAKETAEKAKEAFKPAESAYAQIAQDKLGEAGLTEQDLEALKLDRQEQAALNELMDERGLGKSQNLDPEDAKAMGLNETAQRMAGLSDEERQALQNELANRERELQESLAQDQNLSPQQRQQLQEQVEQTQRMQEALKISEELREALRELANSEEAQKLREAIEQMRQSADQQSQGQPLTAEQMEQLREAMEQAAEAMQDPAVREALRQAMREAAEQLESGQMSLQAAQQMMSALGMLGGEGAVGSDDDFADTGKIERRDDEMETPGKTRTTAVRGEWSDKGDSYSVEIKAPTKLGGTSSVPYQKRLPSARRSAEQAIQREKVPKEHQRRVREYFDSLAGGG